MYKKVAVNRFVSDEFMRLDSKYRIFSDIERFEIWKDCNNIPLSKVLREVNSTKVKKGELEEEMPLVELQNIERFSNNLVDVEFVKDVGSDKVVLNKGDIVIPKLEPRKGQFFLNINHNEYIGSSELIEYEINQKLCNPLWLYYLLVNDKLLAKLRNLESGKAHQRVNPDDLLKVKIPNIPLPIQNEIVEQIKPIEQEILALKKSKSSKLGIVHEVFNEEFGFDWESITPLIENRKHIAKFTEIANDELKFGVSLRLRYIFRHFIKPMPNIKWKALKKIVDVKGGKRLPKGEAVLEEETDYKYIKVEDLNWDGSFDIENIKFISQANHEVIKQYIAETDDILLTIVGATIGKCGLVPEELSDENISENFARLIIKDKNKWNPQYLCYAIMSKCSQFQIDEYTGKSSQGKLAIFRVNKILIPDVDTDKQMEIISRIEQRLYAQKEIDDKIESKRQEIGKLIESVIDNLG